MTRLKALGKWSLRLSPMILLVMSTFNFVEPGQAGLARDRLSGDLTVQSAGIHWTSPTTFVTTIETRPQRVCVPSTAHSAPSCRLVQFDISHYREFVAVEGWSYYWLRNRFSFNSGYETYRGFRDVLRGYAFSTEPYPFVKVMTQ